MAGDNQKQIKKGEIRELLEKDKKIINKKK